MSERILVTGSAGFIGFHVVKKLISSKYKVIGIDNLDKYYDTKLKKDRVNFSATTPTNYCGEPLIPRIHPQVIIPLKGMQAMTMVTL